MQLKFSNDDNKMQDTTGVTDIYLTYWFSPVKTEGMLKKQGVLSSGFTKPYLINEVCKNASS